MASKLIITLLICSYVGTKVEQVAMRTCQTTYIFDSYKLTCSCSSPLQNSTHIITLHSPESLLSFLSVACFMHVHAPGVLNVPCPPLWCLLSGCAFSLRNHAFHDFFLNHSDIQCGQSIHFLRCNTVYEFMSTSCKMSVFFFIHFLCMNYI